MCTISTPGQMAAITLVLGAPLALAPLAASLYAWRRPSRRAAVVALAACALGLIVALLLMTQAGARTTYQATATRIFSGLSLALGVSVAAWALALWRGTRAARPVATVAAALALVALLAWAAYSQSTALASCEELMRPVTTTPATR